MRQLKIKIDGRNAKIEAETEPDCNASGYIEQQVNIRTLEQYLEKKNPKRLQDLKEMMELENGDEDDSM